MSEHTEQMSRFLNDSNLTVSRKPKMALEEITGQLAYSYHEHRLCFVQIDELENGQYLPELQGIVRGFDDESVHFNTLEGLATVELDSIRHIFIPDFIKWYDK